MRIAAYGYILERGAIAAEGIADQLLQQDLVRQSYLGTI
jgi:ABC-type lipopolysaccharide export system ATPase subunit